MVVSDYTGRWHRHRIPFLSQTARALILMQRYIRHQKTVPKNRHSNMSAAERYTAAAPSVYGMQPMRQQTILLPGTPDDGTATHRTMAPPPHTVSFANRSRFALACVLPLEMSGRIVLK